MKKYFLVIGIGILLGLVLGPFQADAGELAYKPMNPSFGGNPFNSGPLMDSANAQNNFTNPASKRSSRPTKSSAEAFADRLDSKILNGVISEVTAAILSEDGASLTDRHVETTKSIIDVDAESSTITITDKISGAVYEISNL